jgi:Fe-S cluster biogenesis protein NfuA
MNQVEKTELIDKINSTIDTLRPYLQADGGDITVEDITEENIVKVKFTGACITCPFSYHTLKAGIEQVILREFPDIKEVISVEN